MPAGTIGVRASGRVTGEEYAGVLLPLLREAADAGEIRLLFAIPPGFDRFDAGAIGQDLRVGISLGIGERHAWRRTAVVTDVDWIGRSVEMFTWLTPGEVRVFPLARLEDAREWVAGSGSAG